MWTKKQLVLYELLCSLTSLSTSQISILVTTNVYILKWCISENINHWLIFLIKAVAWIFPTLLSAEIQYYFLSAFAPDGSVIKEMASASPLVCSFTEPSHGIGSLCNLKVTLEGIDFPAMSCNCFLVNFPWRAINIHEVIRKFINDLKNKIKQHSAENDLQALRKKTLF